MITSNYPQAWADFGFAYRKATTIQGVFEVSSEGHNLPGVFALYVHPLDLKPRARSWLRSDGR
jgi:hypothetical protein